MNHVTDPGKEDAMNIKPSANVFEFHLHKKHLANVVPDAFDNGPFTLVRAGRTVWLEMCMQDGVQQFVCPGTELRLSGCVCMGQLC